MTPTLCDILSKSENGSGSLTRPNFFADCYSNRNEASSPGPRDPGQRTEQVELNRFQIYLRLRSCR
jgi:hypothetical protein